MRLMGKREAAGRAKPRSQRNSAVSSGCNGGEGGMFPNWGRWGGRRGHIPGNQELWGRVPVTSQSPPPAKWPGNTRDSEYIKDF